MNDFSTCDVPVTIFPNLSPEDYRKFAAVSRSDLLLIERSPAYYQFCKNHPEKVTDALRLGTAVHARILTPETFRSNYFVAPMIPPRTTKAGKDAWLNIQYEANGREILTADEAEIIVGIAASVQADRLASALMSNGKAETSIVWTDEITGEDCKARPDYIRETPDGVVIVTDLKTTRDASTEGFTKEAFNLGYPLQAFMYSEAVRIAYGKPVKFYFVAVEKEPPFAVNVFAADEIFVRYGEERFRELVGIYHECKTSGNWYGYKGFSGLVQPLTLPNYVLKNYL